MNVCFNPWFNGLMDKDLANTLWSIGWTGFNPWFNGLMDKDGIAIGKTAAYSLVSTLGLMDWWIKTRTISWTSPSSPLGFNPWFNGLMDKDMSCAMISELLLLVSTLGLMDWWIKTCHIAIDFEGAGGFNPWFNGLMDKDEQVVDAPYYSEVFQPLV